MPIVALRNLVFKKFSGDDLAVAYHEEGGDTYLLNSLAVEIYALIKAKPRQLSELESFFFEADPEEEQQTIVAAVHEVVGQLRHAGVLGLVPN